MTETFPRDRVTKDTMNTVPSKQYPKHHPKCGHAEKQFDQKQTGISEVSQRTKDT